LDPTSSEPAQDDDFSAKDKQHMITN